MLNTTEVHGTRESVQQTVFSLISKLLKAQGITPSSMTLESKIGELGMSSMSFAELVSELEQLYEVDPFEGELSITDIVSVGDLVSAYRHCLAS